MTESRRSALRVIKYGIAMSQEVDMACSRGRQFKEGIAEAAEKALIAGITNLLVLLKEWEEDGPSMSLSFEILESLTYNKGQEFKMARRREQFCLSKDYASGTLSYKDPPL